MLKHNSCMIFILQNTFEILEFRQKLSKAEWLFLLIVKKKKSCKAQQLWYAELSSRKPEIGWKLVYNVQ